MNGAYRNICLSIQMITTMHTGIHIGARTHIQLHAIISRILSMIRTIAMTSSIPRLMLSEFFLIVLAHFLASVEPIPPFLTPLALSEYVIPYGIKMACMKPLPAFMDTVLFSLLSLVTFAKICPSLSDS